MSKMYLIYAYENTYGGLHGMNDMNVVWCDSDHEADECGIEMSYGVMDSYNNIAESLTEQAQS